MKVRIDRLRMVVMESPYDSWSNPLTESLFGKMVGLKLRGYGRFFPYGVLAADTTDLISDHLLICEETSQGLKPIFGNKSVPMKKCELHHLPFPGLSVVEEAHAPLHCRAVNKIILDARYNDVDLRYAGSMTIDPDHAGDKEWSRTLREIFTTMYVNFHQSLTRSEIIAGATIRFKVDNWGEWLGHKQIEHNGKVLEAFRVAHLADEQVVWTYLQEFSLAARQTAKKWDQLWQNRIYIPATLQKQFEMEQDAKKAA